MAQKEATLLLKIKELGSEAIGKVTSLLEGLANTAKYVGAGLVGFGALAVASFREQEEATNKLSQAMINQGIYSADLVKKYEEQASALQALTTFGDEQIIDAQATLQAYIGQREVTKELTLATMNLAAAKKIDLSSAAEMVAKSVGTSTNALARQGIELKDNLTTSERLTSVVEQLNSKFSGQAQAAASGLGSLLQMKNALSDFMELVGERLAPYISFFARQMITFTNTLNQNKSAMQGLESVVVFLSKGFVELKGGIMMVAGVIGTGLAAAVESVSLLTQGQFTKAKEVAALGMSEMKNVIVTQTDSMIEELAMIDEQRQLADDQKKADEILKLQVSEANKTKVLVDEAAKRKLNQDKIDADAKKKQDKLDSEMLAARANFLSHMASLQSSSNQVLASIGKAAAIAQITISTGQAAMDGYKWGMAMGGPILAGIFSALAYTAGAAQIGDFAALQSRLGNV